MTPKKLELDQETLQNLTRPSDHRENATLTFPPACETTGNCHGKAVF